MLDPRFTTQNFFHFRIQKKIMSANYKISSDILQFKKKQRRRWEFHYFLFLTVQKTNKSKKFLCVNKTPIYSTLFRNKGIFSNKIWRKEQIKVLFYFQDLMKFANIAEGFSKQLFAEEYMQKLYIKAFPYRWGRIKGSVHSK